MKNILLIDKKVGQTSLEAIKVFQKNNPEYAETKLTYAGRLDPMAEGLLIVLANEEIKNKEKYLGLDKEYEFEVLFGVETDTYDILGVPSTSLRGGIDDEAIPNKRLPHFVRNDVLNSFIGDKVQSYPPYSSKTVEGKPLFEYARENKLDEIEVPNRMVTIYSIKVLEEREIDAESLKKYIFERVRLVNGDFRQEEILKAWEKFFKTPRHPGKSHLATHPGSGFWTSQNDRSFSVIKFVAKVSSGTYIRSIAHELGKKVGTGAIALNIKRTKIGEFSVLE